MTGPALTAIEAGLSEGRVIPYLGPGMLTLAGDGCALPASPAALAARLGESFGNRRVVTAALGEVFRGQVPPTALHNYLAALPILPLIVHDWYDDLPQRALSVRSGWSTWGTVQGVDRVEHGGRSIRYLQTAGRLTRSVAADASATWATLLYEPLGSVAPALSLIATGDDRRDRPCAIDEAMPIPESVQRLRSGRQFLFLGCRFTEPRDQDFMRQIMRDSSACHWAILSQAPVPQEVRFLAEQNIAWLEMPLIDFVAALAATRSEEKAQRLLASW